MCDNPCEEQSFESDNCDQESLGDGGGDSDAQAFNDKPYESESMLASDKSVSQNYPADETRADESDPVPTDSHAKLPGVPSGQEKRPRGRPRKHPPAPLIKRPRGRPRKQIVEAPCALPIEDSRERLAHSAAFSSSLDVLSAAALSSVISAAPLFAASAAPFARTTPTPNREADSGGEGDSGARTDVEEGGLWSILTGNDGAITQEPQLKREVFHEPCEKVESCNGIDCAQFPVKRSADEPQTPLGIFPNDSPDNKFILQAPIFGLKDIIDGAEETRPCILTDLPTQIKRARGRPRKHQINDLPRRPRGRPPNLNRLASLVKIEGVRRVRGRPPGTFRAKPKASSLEGGVDGEPCLIRKRGRPPKDRGIETLFGTPPKRPRGRPPRHAPPLQNASSPYTYTGPVSLSLASVLSAPEKFDDIYSMSVVQPKAVEKTAPAIVEKRTSTGGLLGPEMNGSSEVRSYPHGSSENSGVSKIASDSTSDEVPKVCEVAVGMQSEALAWVTECEKSENDAEVYATTSYSGNTDHGTDCPGRSAEGGNCTDEDIDETNNNDCVQYGDIIRDSVVPTKQVQPVLKSATELLRPAFLQPEGSIYRDPIKTPNQSEPQNLEDAPIHPPQVCIQTDINTKAPISRCIPQETQHASFARAGEGETQGTQT